jgi:hypothetical protein
MGKEVDENLHLSLDLPERRDREREGDADRRGNGVLKFRIRSPKSRGQKSEIRKRLRL